MLLYLNTDNNIKLDTWVKIPQHVVLYQEYNHAFDDLIIDGLEKKCYTYKIIIDEPIHDPLVMEQTRHVYHKIKGTELYPYHKSKNGLNEKTFFGKIFNVTNSKDIFSTDILMDQITDMGFKGVYAFETGQRLVITLDQFEAYVIGRMRMGKNVNYKAEFDEDDYE